MLNFESVALRQNHALVAARFVPQGKFYAVPEPQFVIDGAEIVFDDVFGGSDFVSDFLVLESLSDKFNDPLFSIVWCSAAVSPSEHNCLLYKSVASFTRLTPPVMLKRWNSRLKW